MGYFRKVLNNIVQPLLKGPHLEPTVHNSYRPISKLSFFSKVLEKVALSHFTSYLDTFNILDPFQFGFRSLHSTESALLKVTNGIWHIVLEFVLD